MLTDIRIRVSPFVVFCFTMSNQFVDSVNILLQHTPSIKGYTVRNKDNENQKVNSQSFSQELEEEEEFHYKLKQMTQKHLVIS